MTSPVITEVGGLFVLEWGQAGSSVDITREALEGLIERVNDARLHHCPGCTCDRDGE